jgi:benzoyl-CoA reductase/2-hydroxyglutaryl-CoA dehydratase subunit BcrC/BadD/HgdB
MTTLEIRPFAEVWRDHADRLALLASSGRRILGYLCTYTPVEMLHAAGFVPVRILGGGTAALSLASTVAPAFVCPYLRRALEKALTGGYRYLSGVVQGYTCDGACGVVNIWELHVPGDLYHTVSLPYMDTREARRFLRAALSELADKLEAAGGRLSESSLEASLGLYEEIRVLARRLYELRSRGWLALSSVEFYTVVLAGLVTPPEEYLPMLRKLVSEAEAAGPHVSTGRGIPVLLSGSVVQDLEVLEILDACGARVVADDLCTGWRAFSPPALGAEKGRDPVERLMDRHFGRFPCPARRKAQERAPLLADLAAGSGAKGVVFLVQKFCTPHLADLPVVLEALQSRGIRGVAVELEEEGVNEGQIRTRLQTFLEMVGA